MTSRTSESPTTLRVGEGTTATFELFNLFSQRPDWVLDTQGAARLRITGTVAAPALPGPSDLQVAYIDEPKGYTYKPIVAAVRVLRIDVARVRIEGTVAVEELSVQIEIEAALVT
ncbi:MAG: hypothetical protein M4D80_02700 [Myxococcota bacterium]|nr:hypothetical protein [Myxococcota bacterium]